MENIWRICPYGEHKIYSRYDIIQFIEKTTKASGWGQNMRVHQVKGKKVTERKIKCRSSLIKARRVKKSSNKLFVREKSIEHMAVMSWSRYKKGTNQILKVSTFNKLRNIVKEGKKERERKFLMLHQVRSPQTEWSGEKWWFHR